MFNFLILFEDLKLSNPPHKSLSTCSKYRTYPLCIQNIKTSKNDRMKKIKILIISKALQLSNTFPVHSCPRALSTKRVSCAPEIFFLFFRGSSENINILNNFEDFEYYQKRSPCTFPCKLPSNIHMMMY